MSFLQRQPSGPSSSRFPRRVEISRHRAGAPHPEHQRFPAEDSLAPFCELRMGLVGKRFHSRSHFPVRRPPRRRLHPFARCFSPCVPQPGCLRCPAFSPALIRPLPRACRRQTLAVFLQKTDVGFRIVGARYGPESCPELPSRAEVGRTFGPKPIGIAVVRCPEGCRLSLKP